MTEENCSVRIKPLLGIESLFAQEDKVDEHDEGTYHDHKCKSEVKSEFSRAANLSDIAELEEGRVVSSVKDCIEGEIGHSALTQRHIL